APYRSGRPLAGDAGRVGCCGAGEYGIRPMRAGRGAPTVGSSPGSPRKALHMEVTMVRRTRPRPTYAGVTATLALFVALSGGAYAAATLPANSVGAKQIKKSAVERGKIKRNAIDGSKVLDNALTGEDIKESTLDEVPAADE